MLHTRAHRSPQRVKRLDHIAQFGAHLHQPGDGLTLAADAFGIAAQLLLGGIKFKPTVFHKIMYHAYALHVVGSVEARATVVAPWLDDGKLLFPETERTHRQSGQLCHLADLIEFFINRIQSVVGF